MATSDGLTIRAWWIPVRNSARTLIVAHGSGSNAIDVFQFAKFLHKAGYNTVLFDWRGHGRSDGHRVTYGLHEVKDVRAVVDWLRTTHAAESAWIGAMGVSMATGILMQAAGTCPEIRAFVLDSPWVSLRSLMATFLRNDGIPEPFSPVLVPLCDLWHRVFNGVGLDAVSPIDHVSEPGARPVFLVHGEADRNIPFEQAKTLARAPTGPHECWIVPGAVHVQASGFGNPCPRDSGWIIATALQVGLALRRSLPGT